MSISVKVPTILRTYTDGSAEVTVTGETLAANPSEDRKAHHYRPSGSDGRG